MAAKPFWRRISVHRLNLLLYAVIVVLTAVYWQELRWAAHELPEYLDGEIGSPVERKLVRQARKLVRQSTQLDSARELLEKSVAIDPTSEAVFWLGECHFAAGRNEQALEQFRRYIEIDPAEVDSYLRAAEILADRGDRATAREVLEQGRVYFSDHLESYRPQLDPDVAMKFNEKAIDVYRYFGDAVTELEGAIARLGGAPALPDGD